MIEINDTKNISYFENWRAPKYWKIDKNSKAAWTAGTKAKSNVLDMYDKIYKLKIPI